MGSTGSRLSSSRKEGRKKLLRKDNSPRIKLGEGDEVKKDAYSENQDREAERDRRRSL